MFEVLQAYLERGFPLSKDDIEVIHAVFQPRKLKKGEFLQRGGEIPRYGAFVSRGFLRSYVIDDKGKEHVVQFAPENWWISDKGGLSTPNPSDFFIDAIEDSEILLIDQPGHETMIQKVPGYAASFQVGMQKRTAAKDQRIVHTLIATPGQRYKDFLETYPSIAQRVPQHMLASYLGMTPETLSRVRKQLSKK